MLATSIIVLVVGCSKPRAADPLINEAREGNAQECEQFVKSGLPVDMTDDDGDTALDWAVFSCKPDVVRKLIELGANVNHVDVYGSNASGSLAQWNTGGSQRDRAVINRTWR
jgi:ankyrin repeat protein